MQGTSENSNETLRKTKEKSDRWEHYSGILCKAILKMVCNCIYKKVDESSEDKKEKAYKSFHILSEYLENKGVTWIIYPCTRDNTISGKNLVLFRKEEAVPVENSIRKIIY